MLRIEGVAIAIQAKDVPGTDIGAILPGPTACRRQREYHANPDCGKGANDLETARKAAHAADYWIKSYLPF